jgi:gas vesicle protein
MQRIRERRRSSGQGTDIGANNVGLLIGGIGIGALLMYLFDPDRGRGRRARLGDQLSSKVNRLGEAAEAKARDLRNRAQGVVHEARSILPGGESAEESRRDNEGANDEASNSRTAG